MRIFSLIFSSSLVFIIPFAFVFAEPRQDLVWTAQNDGISGSSIVGIAVDPSATSTVYALTAASGLYKSTNGGSPWSVANTGISGAKNIHGGAFFGNLLTMDPNDSATLYAAFGGRVYKTEDGATSWTEINEGISDCFGVDTVVGVAIDPNDANHLIAGRIVSTCTDSYFESTDGGETWNGVRPDGAIANDSWIFAFDPFVPVYRYIATVYLGFLRSEDSNATWTQSRASSETEGTALMPHPSIAGRILYGGGGEGIFISGDSGQTWNFAGGVGRIRDIRFAPSNTDIGYAVSVEGLFKTSDAGETWSEIGSHEDLSGWALAIDPSDEDVLYLGSSSRGMFKSTNGGLSFSEINTGIPLSINASAIGISSSNPDVYYSSISGVGFFRSTDRGYTWHQQSTSYTAVNESQYILVDPTNDDVLYAGFDEIYISTDAGVTWALSEDPSGTNYFQAASIDPENPLHVIAADNNSLVTYQTFDGGDTWETIASLSPSSYIYGFVFDPTDSNVVYASTYDHVWKSADNGLTWVEKETGLTTGLDNQIDALAIDPTDTSILYAGTRADHVMKSIDAGESWSATTYVSDNITTSPNQILVDTNGVVYAFNTYGWEKSETRGDTWETLSTEGLTSAFYTFKYLARFDPTDENRIITGDFYQGILIFEKYVHDFTDSEAEVSDENEGETLPDDVALYEITIENTGKAEARETVFSVHIPEGGEFKEGSATIDGGVVAEPLFEDDSGQYLEFSLGTLLAEESSILRYGIIAHESIGNHQGIISAENDAGTEINLPAFEVTGSEENNNSEGGKSSRNTKNQYFSNTSNLLDPSLRTELLTLLRELLTQFIALGGVPSPQAIAFLNISSTTSEVFTRDLMLGSVGNDVRELQILLIGKKTGPQAALLEANGATHYFGVLTQAALAEYQIAHFIVPASGYFGPVTRALFNILR